jgi:hypothetical protein
MARKFFGVEKGFDIYAENGNLLSRILSGTAAPDGLGDQASAPIGSIYLRSGTSGIYEKITNVGNSSDWQLNGAGSASVGTWRPENIVLVTNETQGAGTRDVIASPFTDDNGTVVPIGSYAIGKYIISDADGTPVLLEITNVAGDNVTFALAASPLASGDTFITTNYLPDPDGFENQAIVNYNGAVVVKISDIDWAIATGINLSGGYVASSGNVAAGDTVESAISKLDGINDNQDTLLGTAQGATNLGSWTAPVTLLFSATSTVKALFQRIGDLLMQLRGVQATGITAITTVDSVPHATVKCVKWIVEAFEEATPANRKAFEVLAVTDGTNVDDNQSGILRIGGNFNLSVTVDISGADMRLRITSSTAGVTVTARRIEVVKTVL